MHAVQEEGLILALTKNTIYWLLCTLNNIFNLICVKNKIKNDKVNHYLPKKNLVYEIIKWKKKKL